MPSVFFPTQVRIGRTLQSFPPSTRSGRLSTHSAFQLGRTTLVGQSSLDDCQVHQPFHCRHLLSLLPLLTLMLFSFPWPTFTLSPPLQRGIWLLRCLRPPARKVAFSRPTQVGAPGLEFPSSTAGAARVP